MRTLYKNLTIVDSDGTRDGEVLVENKKIKNIYLAPRKCRAKYEMEVDCDGLTLMPGFTDTHSHLRDPGLTYKEDINTGLHAAAKGGFTTVCAMANTRPIIDSADKVEANLKKAKEVDLTRLIQVASLTRDFGEELSDLDSLAAVTPMISNDGFNVDNPELMVEGLKKTLEHPNLIIATHNEPETETVVRDIEILRETGGRLHICHISKEDTLKAIEQAKKDGLNITCEVTPHHVYASCLEYKVHPPFRTNRDKMAMIQGIKDGIIDTCGTDHAPHSDEDKNNGAPGINNFETAFALYNTVFQENNIPLERLSEMLSLNPNRILGLEGGKIEKEMPADFVLVDPNQEWQINKHDLISKSHNTPFHRDWVKGKVHMTVRDGKVIYESDESRITRKEMEEDRDDN